MAKISSAYLDYPELNVNLDNGHGIFIPLTSQANASRFAGVLTPKCEYNPRTDGTSVYWRDGASLTLEDIMGIVEGVGV